jgi:hypothetical protein
MLPPYAKFLTAEMPMTASRSESPAAGPLSSSLFVLLSIGFCLARLCQSFAIYPTQPETSYSSNLEVPRAL